MFFFSSHLFQRIWRVAQIQSSKCYTSYYFFPKKARQKLFALCYCSFNLLVPLLLRPNVFPGGDKIGLDADEDDACWIDGGFRTVKRCAVVDVL